MELPNVVDGAAVDEIPKPPMFEPDPKPLDELDPKAVDVEPKLDVLAGAWPNVVDPDDEPKPEDAAGWADDDEPNVNAGVEAGADDIWAIE